MLRSTYESMETFASETCLRKRHSTLHGFILLSQPQPHWSTNVSIVCKCHQVHLERQFDRHLKTYRTDGTTRAGLHCWQSLSLGTGLPIHWRDEESSSTAWRDPWGRKRLLQRDSRPWIEACRKGHMEKWALQPIYLALATSQRKAWRKVWGVWVRGMCHGRAAWWALQSVQPAFAWAVDERCWGQQGLEEKREAPHFEVQQSCRLWTGAFVEAYRESIASWRYTFPSPRRSCDYFPEKLGDGFPVGLHFLSRFNDAIGQSRPGEKVFEILPRRLNLDTFWDRYSPCGMCHSTIFSLWNVPLLRFSHHCSFMREVKEWQSLSTWWTMIQSLRQISSLIPLIMSRRPTLRLWTTWLGMPLETSMGGRFWFQRRGCMCQNRSRPWEILSWSTKNSSSSSASQWSFFAVCPPSSSAIRALLGKCHGWPSGMSL